MLVILDDGPRRIFSAPLALIRADTVGQVPDAIAAVEAALRQGRHVAGWLSYELGYGLEPRLAGYPAPAPLLQLGVFSAPDDDVPPVAGRAYAGPLRPEWDQAAYASRFARVKEYIAAGDIYQANLSFRARFSFLGEPRVLYEQLRGQSGAAHCAYVDANAEEGGPHILSLSPELFFDLSEDGRITVRPMKGTSPRGVGARGGDDAAERAELAASAKDRAENLMIVDLIRNDLSRIAELGSVEVSDLFKVETYPTLHTMVSTVTARKRKEAGVADILRALFPCGSVTGAPKIRAMEILRELETSPRGVYCGAIGHFAPDGSALFNVAIRTLTVRGNQGELGIGGGVVQDSRMASEYAECLLKARFFESARKPLELIETLRCEPGLKQRSDKPLTESFVRLASHLARMKLSAGTFAMPFDEVAACTALEDAVASKTGPQRVRLTLNEQGVYHATAHDLPSNPAHWTYTISPERTHSGDVFLRHKTSWRELYESEVKRLGTDEVIFLNERGELTEGARSNIFIRRGDVLVTPPLSTGLLDGCLRAELIAQDKAREAVLMLDDLMGDVFFGNSLRGLIPAKRV